MLSILKVTTVEYSDVQADCESDAKAGILEASRYVETSHFSQGAGMTQAHNLHVTIPSESFYNSAFIAN